MASAEWKHPTGTVFEMKRVKGEWWHRRKGEPEEHWRRGHPPGFLPQPKGSPSKRREG